MGNEGNDEMEKILVVLQNETGDSHSATIMKGMLKTFLRIGESQ